MTGLYAYLKAIAQIVITIVTCLEISRSVTAPFVFSPCYSYEITKGSSCCVISLNCSHQQSKVTFPFTNFIDLEEMASLSSTAQKILATLAHLCQLHDDDEHVATRQHVSALSNLLMNSTFRAACAKLKAMNLIEYHSKSSISLTSQGMQVANDLSDDVVSKLPTTNEAIQDEIKTKFLQKNKKALQVFELMVDGRDYNKKELAIQVGCPTYNSTIRAAFAFLKTRNIVEYTNTGSIRLSSMCVPFGRPSAFPIHQPSAVRSTGSV
jgi:hypothetical protein